MLPALIGTVKIAKRGTRDFRAETGTGLASRSSMVQSDGNGERVVADPTNDNGPYSGSSHLQCAHRRLSAGFGQFD